eukprot:COSAG05_NODE_1170_length_5624_cov_2.536360_6_plen_85_part_00
MPPLCYTARAIYCEVKLCACFHVCETQVEKAAIEMADVSGVEKAAGEELMLELTKATGEKQQYHPPSLIFPSAFCISVASEHGG